MTGYRSSAIAALRKDKKLAPLLKKHGPMVRHTRTNPFQSLVRSIVYQQVSGAAAASIMKRFAALFPHEKFPTPEQVLALPPETLRGAGLSPQKTAYIIDLSIKFADGTITPQTLRRMSNEEVIMHLTRVKGIGVWTAHMFLMSTLQRQDILPTGDLGIQKGFQVVYGLRALPTHKKMETLARPWRAYASVASWYLWREADAQKKNVPVKKHTPRSRNK